MPSCTHMLMSHTWNLNHPSHSIVIQFLSALQHWCHCNNVLFTILNRIWFFLYLINYGVNYFVFYRFIPTLLVQILTHNNNKLVKYWMKICIIHGTNKQFSWTNVKGFIFSRLIVYNKDQLYPFCAEIAY